MSPIQTFQCPSCGASISYDGGPETTISCQFCGTNVVVPAEMRAQATSGQPQATPIAPVAAVSPADKMAEQLKNLAQNGHKIEAIKLYRGIYHVRRKDAKAAVEAIENGASIAQAQASAAPQPKRTGVLVTLGSVGCGVLFCVGLVAFILAMTYTLNFSASYKQALDAARSDPSVIDALGAPVEAQWWPATGEISCGEYCYADYTIPIHGSRKSGYIVVMSHSSGGALNEGTWHLDASVHVDGGGMFTLK
jgi:ribosomal protein L7/L12